MENINQSIVFLIDFIGIIQGIVLGTLLLFINRKQQSTIFLGCFILAYSLEMIPGVITNLGLEKEYPMLAFLPVNFFLLQFPLFYVYIQKVSIFSRANKINYTVLYPGLLYFVLQLVVFLLPSSFREVIINSLWYASIDVLGLIFSIWVGIKTVRWINHHIKEVGKQYSNIAFKELRWARVFVLFGIAYIIFSFFLYGIWNTQIIDVVFSIVNVGLLYWVSLRGIMQLNINSVQVERGAEIENVIDNEEKEHVKNNNANDENEDLRKVADKIGNYIKMKSLYTNPELSIGDLSNELKLHSKYISKVINTVHQQNFNTYINTFRINKAKELLADVNYSKYSLEGIGEEVGYLNKSTFYRVFKKMTGLTPNEFKKEQAQ
ncbi:helix-turn-helix domain-containing protein [Tenacibaculum sp. TC6]|uniref:helix-turn-helix domain-containing protein n=1 Tax=Tenacibaculum sp. TC6 TaxID=3423223 RepID=UPI003D36C2DF